MEQWQGFKGKTWKQEVDVRDFIINNFSEYTGDESFLAGPTETTTQLWDQVMILLSKKEKLAAYWTWIQKLYLPLHLIQQAI